MGLVVLGVVGVALLAAVGAWGHRDALRVAHALWGLLTLLVFAPAGGVLAIALGDHAPFGAAATGMGAASGLFAGVSMLVAAFRGERGGTRRWLGPVLVAHHALILVVFGAVPWLESGALDPVWPAMLAIPCGVGLALGAATGRAPQFPTNRTRSTHTLEGGSHV